jgi:uncharacterized protein with GYD domain
MARYMMIVNYAPEGARGLLTAGGSARKSVIEKAVAGLGGRLETFDFAFGTEDAYTIVDLPDAASATALALTVNASGSVHLRTAVLVSPEEVDRAAQLHPDYTPPGQNG